MDFNHLEILLDTSISHYWWSERYSWKGRKLNWNGTQCLSTWSEINSFIKDMFCEIDGLNFTIELKYQKDNYQSEPIDLKTVLKFVKSNLPHYELLKTLKVNLYEFSPKTNSNFLMENLI